MSDKIRMWVDQEGCTGCSICADECPELFIMWDRGPGSDGLAYAKPIAHKTGMGEDKTPLLKGESGTVVVPERLLEDVVYIADQCPGEIIFLETCNDC